MGDNGIDMAADDEEMEKWILKRLDEIDINDPEEDSLSDDGNENGTKYSETETMEEQLAISQYLDIIQNNTKNAEKRLMESKEVLELPGKEIDHLAEIKLKETFGSTEDLLQLRKEALAEIEDLENKEEAEIQFSAEGSQDNMAVAVMQTAVSNHIDALEEEAREKLLLLRSKQAAEEEKQKEAAKQSELERIRNEEDHKRRQEEEQREFERKQMELAEQDKIRRASMDIVIQEKQKEIKKLEELFLMQMKEIEVKQQSEKEAFIRLKGEEKEREMRKRNNAATQIQKHFKSYRVRKMYGSTLSQLKTERKQKEEERLDQIERVEARIRAENEMKRKKEIEQQQKEKEERARKKEEEKLKLQEEQKRLQEEQERLRKVEEERVEMERKEREKKEQKRREEQKQKREEEKKKLKEMEKKREEEREREEQRKKEKEKIEQEKRRREEEQRVKEMQRQAEEERKKDELRREEERRKMEIKMREEQKQREEEQRLEDRRIREVEERKIETEKLAGKSMEITTNLKEEEMMKKRLKTVETKCEEEDGDGAQKNAKQSPDREKIEEKKRKSTMNNSAMQEGEITASYACTSHDNVHHNSKAGNSQSRLENLPVKKELLITTEHAQDTCITTVVNQNQHEFEFVEDKVLPMKDVVNQVNENKAFGGCSDEQSVSEKELYLKELCEKWKEVNHVIRSEPRKSLKKASASRRQRKTTQQVSQEDISEDMILAASEKGTLLNEVTTVVLKDLPGISIGKLSAAPKIKVVKIKNCGISTLEGFNNSEDLIELNLKVNRIEHLSTVNGKSLVSLNLKENNISSFHGLENCTNLENADFSMNKITRINGLPACSQLLYLNLQSNQLVSTKNFGFYDKLLSLNISNNHLTEIAEVEYCPLLRFLSAKGNNIHEIPNLRNNVLLQELHLDQNCISNLNPLTLAWLPLLQTLSLSGNSITHVPSIRNLISLRHLDLRDNLIQSSKDILEGSYQCQSLDELRINGNPCTTDSASRSQIWNAIPWLSKLDDEVNVRKFPRDYLSSFESLAQSQLQEWHQIKEKYSKEIRPLSSRGEVPTSQRVILKSSAKSLHRKECLKLSVKHLKEQLGECVDQEIMQEQSQGKQNAPTHQEDTTAVKREDRIIPEEEGTLENRTPSQEDRADDESSRKENAATLIQAVIRGYLVRRRLHYVLYNRNRPDIVEDSDEFDYDEEVDLSAFEFDDANMEWAAPRTPQLPAKYSVLPPTNASETVDTEEYGDPRHAWMSPNPIPIESPTFKGGIVSADVSPDDGKSVAASRMSSRRAEELSSEWGFKNSLTAEMMMKRAKRMNRSTKKHKSDADKRLAYFKKIQTLNRSDIVQPWPKRKQEERIEYFSAKAHQLPSALSSTGSESEAKKMMTFRWVHDQAVLHKGEHADIIAHHERKQSTGSQNTSPQGAISLPMLDPEIIAGKRVPLVMEMTRTPKERDKSHPRHALEKSGVYQTGEKSRSAPNPSERTPPVMPSSPNGSNRTGSADARWRRYGYKR